MDTKTEQEGLHHIKRIERELSELNDHTPGPTRSFKNGIFQGMGAVLGSIIAVALLGILLSFLGVIPGFDHLAQYIQGLMDSAHSR